MNDQQTNTLTDVYKVAFKALLSQELNTGLPGMIEKVIDFKKKKVSVKPLIKKIYLDERELILPIIENVPVVYPESDDCILQIPLKKGMKVWLSFSQRSMDTYLSTGIDSIPGNTSKFSLSDAVAFLGCRDFKEEHPLIENNTDFGLIYKGNKIIIKEDNSISLNNENGSIVMEQDGLVNINDGSLTVESW